MDQEQEAEINISSAYNEICRLCFTQGKLKNVTTLNWTFFPTLISVLESTLGHNLPGEVCICCLKELRRIDLFIGKCKHSLDTLNQLEKECEKLSSREVEIKILNSDRILLSNLHNNNCKKNVTMNKESVEVDESMGVDEVTKYIKEEERPEFDEDNSEMCIEENFEDVSVRETELGIPYTQVVHTPDSSDEIENEVKKIHSPILNARECSIKKELFSDELKINFDTFFLKDEKLSTEKRRIRKKSFVDKKEATNDLKICDTCGEAVLMLSDHYKVSKSCRRKEISCPECKETFLNRDRLRCHTKAKHWKDDDEYFMCHICSKMVKYKMNLKRHMLQHTGNKQFICEICGKGFTTKIGLTDHTNLHTGEKPFNCSSCEKTFSARATRDTHQKRHWASEAPNDKANDVKQEPKRFFCKICKKKFKSQEKLERHEFEHTGEAVKCERCKEKFQTKQQLYSHVRTKHKKPTFCTLCFKSFKQHATLVQHLRTHTGEKPYRCTHCSKTFSQRAHLYYHTLLHTGEKSYACTFCNKKFTLKGNLTVHVRLHTGERPYKCHVCHQGFRDASARKRHVIKRHGEQQVQFICGGTSALNEV